MCHKLSLLFLLFFSCVIYTFGADYQCNQEGLKKSDEYSARLWMFGHESRRFPTNDGQMRKFCEDTKKYEVFMRGYSKKCFKGVSKSLGLVLTYSLAKIGKQSCTIKKKRRDLLRYCDCANQNLNATSGCLDVFKNEITTSATEPDPKFRVGLMCCTFFKWKECTLNSLTNVGPPKCTDDAVYFIETYINRMAIDSLKLLCGDYTEESDKCSKIAPRLAKLKLVKAKWKSPLIPAINLLNNLPV